MGSTSAKPGELIAQKYRVLCPLGEGGMGVVLLAVHEPLGAKVAIKVLSHHGGRSLPDEKRFLFEAQAAAQLKSEHVAHVTDFGTLDDGRQYMVMEYLEGEDLSARLHRCGRLPVAEAADFLIQTCAGLAEAHASGIIHRDIKPSNLFVTRTSDGSERIKVLDFGVSKFQLGDGGYHALTSTGLAVGTPLYMSPEQVHGSKNIDARSDVWSLGVVFYELCTGKTPFYDESLGVTLLNVLEKRHPTLRNSGVDLSDDLERIVDACLAKDPAGRPESVSALAGRLWPFASVEGQRLAERIPAIAKRAGARVQVSLPPPKGAHDQPTMRVAEANAVGDSGAGSRPGETPPPGRATTSAPVSRSRFAIPIAAGFVILTVASVVALLSRGGPKPATPAATSEVQATPTLEPESAHPPASVPTSPEPAPTASASARSVATHPPAVHPTSASGATAAPAASAHRTLF